MNFKKAVFQSYAEIPQQSVITFALALQEQGSEDIIEKFYPFKCRDFFNEIVWKQWTGKDYPIYGFKTSNFPVVKDETVYLTCYGVSDILLKTWKTILSKFDKRLKITKIDDVILVKLPKCYIRYTFLISYLTFYMRCIELFPTDIFNPTSGNEGSYAARIKLMTKRSMEDVYNAFKTFIADPSAHFQDHCGNAQNIDGVYNNHNKTGIVATLCNPENLFRKHCESYWNKEESSVSATNSEGTEHV